MSDLSHDFAALLGLMVHDLRNPTATVSANLEFLRDQPMDEFGKEALDDVVMATDELRRGLEVLGWIARWLGGDPAVNIGAPEDLVQPLRKLADQLDAEFRCSDASLLVPGVNALRDVTEIYLRSAERHARRRPRRVELTRDGAGVRISVVDAGEVVAPEHRDQTFTLSGQKAVKGRPDARYARYVGFLAARAVAETLRGEVGTDEVGGEARFWIRVPSASS